MTRFMRPQGIVQQRTLNFNAAFSSPNSSLSVATYHFRLCANSSSHTASINPFIAELITAHTFELIDRHFSAHSVATMPFLSDFPNEILDELMECILAISPPSQLQAFLLSRQYNPSVLRALYLDVRFLVNSDSQMASLKDANDEKMTGMF